MSCAIKPLNSLEQDSLPISFDKITCRSEVKTSNEEILNFASSKLEFSRLETLSYNVCKNSLAMSHVNLCDNSIEISSVLRCDQTPEILTFDTNTLAGKSCHEMHQILPHVMCNNSFEKDSDMIEDYGNVKAADVIKDDYLVENAVGSNDHSSLVENAVGSNDHSSLVSSGARDRKAVLADLERQNPGLSKNQLKKLAKWQKFDARKRELRLNQRRKEKERAKSRVSEGGLTRGEIKRLKLAADERLSGVSVVFDLDFASYMTDRDLCKLSQQIGRCYASNRKSCLPLKCHLTSLNGKMASEFKRVNHGYLSWTSCIQCHDQHYTSLFAPERLVYLTAEASTSLAKLESDCVYVIGGLVDHNGEKGLCERLAQERGIRTASLPIDTFLHLPSRKILTVNQVFEILLQFVSCQDWEKSLLAVIPQRKGATLIQQTIAAGGERGGVATSVTSLDGVSGIANTLEDVEPHAAES